MDGHDAWIIEMHLTFDIPGIKTKGEGRRSWSSGWEPATGSRVVLLLHPGHLTTFTWPAEDALDGLRVT